LQGSSKANGAAAAAAAASSAGGGLWKAMIGGKSAVKLHAGVMTVAVLEQDLSGSCSGSTTDNVQFEVRV
jgi:hypothetical protein